MSNNNLNELVKDIEIQNIPVTQATSPTMGEGNTSHVSNVQVNKDSVEPSNVTNINNSATINKSRNAVVSIAADDIERFKNHMREFYVEWHKIPDDEFE